MTLDNLTALFLLTGILFIPVAILYFMVRR